MITPRLAILSPVLRCGKTTLLDVLAALVYRPLPAANCSASSIFRVVEKHRPCLLIDEADSFLSANEELRGVLNSGHRRGGSVLRNVGDDHEPRAFATYAACAIAMIGQLPGTLADRSVTIGLVRRKADEAVDPFRFVSSMENAGSCASNACHSLHRRVPCGETSRRAGCRRSARPVRSRALDRAGAQADALDARQRRGGCRH